MEKKDGATKVTALTRKPVSSSSTSNNSAARSTPTASPPVHPSSLRSSKNDTAILEMIETKTKDLVETVTTQMQRFEALFTTLEGRAVGAEAETLRLTTERLFDAEKRLALAADSVAMLRTENATLKEDLARMTHKLQSACEGEQQARNEFTSAKSAWQQDEATLRSQLATFQSDLAAAETELQKLQHFRVPIEVTTPRVAGEQRNPMKRPRLEMARQQQRSLLEKERDVSSEAVNNRSSNNMNGSPPQKNF